MHLPTLLTIPLFALLTTTTPLSPRQNGGGPNDPSTIGTGGWNTNWRDTTLRAPTSFRAVRLQGCTYQVSFSRDVRDTKYKLAYFGRYGSGEGGTSRERKPSSLGYTGSEQSGMRTYTAVVEGCKTDISGQPAPNGFSVYFTESTGKTGYVKGFPVSS